MSRILLATTTLVVLAATWAAPLGGWAPVARADDDVAVGHTAVVASTDGDALRLRGSAGLSGAVQGTLREGTRVQVVEGPQTADGFQWYRVAAGASGGWVPSRYLSAGDDRTVLSAAAGSAARGPVPPASAASAASSGSPAAASASAATSSGALSSAAGPLPPGGRTLQARVTAYNLGSGARTATGTTARFGTVAVDPQVIPLGTRLMIQGYEGTVFVAEDTGSAVRGNLIDIWLDDPAAAGRYGTQTRTITILDR
ncbi:MAG TPA: 3D domain-containing protein [Chloroflexota bacterium]|jgi:3D (Asp-Asp-Asp) domain-containing protein